jgi:hypothetical protein
LRIERPSGAITAHLVVEVVKIEDDHVWLRVHSRNKVDDTPAMRATDKAEVTFRIDVE